MLVSQFYVDKMQPQGHIGRGIGSLTLVDSLRCTSTQRRRSKANVLCCLSHTAEDEESQRMSVFHFDVRVTKQEAMEESP